MNFLIGGNPPVPFSQDFSDNTGLGGWYLSGSNATVTGGKLVITPVQGTQQVDAAVSTCDNAGNWVKYGNNTMVSSGGSLVCTYVDTTNGAYDYLKDSSDLAANLTVGGFYDLRLKAKVNTGEATIRIHDGAGATVDRTVSSTNLVQHYWNFCAKHASNGMVLLFGLGTGEVISIDDFVLYPLSNTIITRRAKAGNLIVGAAINIAERGTMGGVLINVDKSADQNPNNYLVAILTRGNSDGASTVQLLKFANGSPSTVLASTIVSYVAGAVLQIEQSNSTTYRVSYNSSQVGIDQTVSDDAINANIYAGILGMYGGNSLDRFFLASGPLRRFSALGDSITTPTSGSNQWIDIVCRDYLNGKNLLFNRAVGGESIMTDMADQVTAVASDDADIIIIELGANDNDAGDMEALQAEVEEQIGILKASNPRATIYYLNVLPCWEDETGVVEKDKSHIRAAIALACTAQNVTCWDTYTAPWLTASDTVDGVHPTPDGEIKIANEVLKRI